MQHLAGRAVGHEGASSQFDNLPYRGIKALVVSAAGFKEVWSPAPSPLPHKGPYEFRVTADFSRLSSKRLPWSSHHRTLGPADKIVLVRIFESESVGS